MARLYQFVIQAGDTIVSMWIAQAASSTSAVQPSMIQKPKVAMRKW